MSVSLEKVCYPLLEDIVRAARAIMSRAEHGHDLPSVADYPTSPVQFTPSIS
ncbi:MAG: hypothetical protein KKC28_15145 [Verrucomicrobia bacterium]|nr:hypothetical protein [Verrucomicrobiota bacterium]